MCLGLKSLTEEFKEDQWDDETISLYQVIQIATFK